MFRFDARRLLKVDVITTTAGYDDDLFLSQ
jgi:hypothetical protein